MIESRPLDMTTVLAPVRRSLGLARMRQLIARGLVIGITAGAVALAADHLWPLEWSGSVGLLLVLLGALGGALMALARWPSSLEAARAADSQFGLQDRLTSALELYASSSPIARLHQADVRSRVRKLPLHRTRGTGARRSEEAIVLGLTFLFAVLYVTGTTANPKRLTSAGPTYSQRIHRAATVTIPNIIGELNRDLSPTQRQDPTTHQVNALLAHLRARLAQMPGLTNTLRSISVSQQELQRIESQTRPLSPASLGAMARALNRVLDSPVGRTGSGATAQGLAQGLKHLANALGHESPARQEQVAKALAKAARASGGGRLQTALHQAATWLGPNHSQSARASSKTLNRLSHARVRSGTHALRRAASLLSQSAAERAMLNRLGQTKQQLDALKSQVAGLSPKSPNRQAGAPHPGSLRSGSSEQLSSAAHRVRQGRVNGAPSYLRRGLKHNFLSTLRYGASRGKATNSVALGQIGVSRQSGGEFRQGTSRGKDRFRAVYLAGRKNSGYKIVERGPNGTPQQARFETYQQVVARYVNSAHAALDHTALPPSLNSYVRQYFTVISH